MPTPGPTSEYAIRLPDGAIRIRAKLQASAPRKELQRRMLPPKDVKLEEWWERAHAIAARLGAERAEGILYAPRAVNDALQSNGIERFVQDVVRQRASDVEIYLTTTTRAHPKTRRLASIEYIVEAVRDGTAHVLYEAEIVVTNSRTAPKAYVTVRSRADVEQFLRPLPPRIRRVPGVPGRSRPPRVRIRPATSSRGTSERGVTAAARSVGRQLRAITPNVLMGIVSSMAADRRIADARAQTGYAARGVEYGDDNVLFQATRYLQDVTAGGDFDLTDRFDITRWRAVLRQRADSVTNGGRMTVGWEVQIGANLPRLHPDRSIEVVRIVYRKYPRRFPGQGQWLDLSAESDPWPENASVRRVPDIDFIIDPARSDADIERYLGLSAPPRPGLY